MTGYLLLDGDLCNVGDTTHEKYVKTPRVHLAVIPAHELDELLDHFRPAHNDCSGADQ